MVKGLSLSSKNKNSSKSKNNQSNGNKPTTNTFITTDSTKSKLKKSKNVDSISDINMPNSDSSSSSDNFTVTGLSETKDVGNHSNNKINTELFPKDDKSKNSLDSPDVKSYPDIFKLRSNKFTDNEMKIFREEVPKMQETLDWKFSQIKGTEGTDDEVNEPDIISTVKFNDDGELLATGDKGGRIVIFKRDNANTSEYNVYSTFQSHEPEFDYLKSLEIEEKINKIRWLPARNASHFLLSTNDKTIKLWKISEKDTRITGWNLPDQTNFEDSNYSFNNFNSNNNEQTNEMDTSEGVSQTGDNNSNRKFISKLQVPKLERSELMIESYPKKIYSNAHTYHVNSISVNTDNQTFLSADDLRVNIWDLERTNNSFNIIDIKPTNMEDLSEVITSAEFHPSHCHILAYSSSRGTIRLCDMRESALCDKHALLFEQELNPQERTFFSEIIASISDIAFSPGGRYMLSRDYLTVKLWDMCMPGCGPVDTFPVHKFLSQKLCTLYENDCIFDKFEICWSHDGSQFMTGSYHNLFRVGLCNSDHNRQNITSEFKWSHLYHANIDPKDLPVRTSGMHINRPQLFPKRILVNSSTTKNKIKKRFEIPLDSLDYKQKVLHADWHPTEHIISVAATNRLLIYDAKDK